MIFMCSFIYVKHIWLLCVFCSSFSAVHMFLLKTWDATEGYHCCVLLILVIDLSWS